MSNLLIPKKVTSESDFGLFFGSHARTAKARNAM